MRRSSVLGLAIAVSAGLALCGCGSPGDVKAAAGKPAGAGRPAAAGKPAAGRPAAAAQAVTVSAARQVVAAYVAGNNRSNRLRSARVLAGFEGGSSRAIDAAGYRQSKALHPRRSGYPAFVYTSEEFYIPAQRGYPHWFVFRGRSQDRAAGAKPEKGYSYLLFARRTAAAPWLDVLEPDTSGTADTAVPAVAIGAGGQAAAVTGTAAARLAVPAGEVAKREAAFLAGPGSGPAPLADDTLARWVSGQRAYWAKSGLLTSVSFRAPHAAPYALRTPAGGALVMGDLTGTLTVRPPAGRQMNAGVSGIVSGHDITRLTITVDAQFLVSDPAAGHGKPALLGYLAGYTGGRS